MTNSRLQNLDIRLLRYFAVVAEENNISRAAQRLFISQPPLSRHIRHLEAQLGLTLFLRHTKGLILTEEGRRVLDMVRPLLALQERTLAALSQLSAHSQQPLRLGLTTAFEQGVFAAAEAALGEHNRALHITRQPSPALAQRVRKGTLDAALIALPLNTDGLHLRALSYYEPLRGGARRARCSAGADCAWGRDDFTAGILFCYSASGCGFLSSSGCQSAASAQAGRGHDAGK